ncbi:hypothetical protein E4T48_03850 [Aureobasidium sp. EXF-10727]|nr:hypothetical protein E4T48_03850 [Aureobasidium sp. EXF-10727]
MQSSNTAESGGLNFVFESGSSGRENKKYVRSHAAKVGWSQRSRKQAQAGPKDVDVDVAVTKDKATPRKRRKTTAAPAEQQHQPINCSPAPQPSVNRPVNHQAEAPAGAGASSQSSPSTAASLLPQQDALNRHGYSASQPPAPAILAPTYSSAPIPSSAPSYHFNHRAQPASVPLPHVETSPPVRVATTAGPTYSSTQALSPWHTRPEPVHHDPAAPQSFVPLFRPAASPVTMHPPQPMPGPDILRPVPPASPLHSPRLPPLVNTPTSRPLMIGANWRQYDNMSATNPGSSRPSTPALPATTRHEEHTDASATTPRRPSPKGTSTPAFLELVLNEEYPMWKSVDSGSDSFNVFPVKWQPFYGRLLQNYRSNMLVQLDEILTGWTVDQKLEFNQMPLRLAGSEPCLFYSLLATASIMMPPGLISRTIPRWLQNRTVECLNQAFADPKRAYSDATILTLNMVALFESCSGHASIAASTHQPVLRRMVDERGGLARIAKTDNEDSKNFVRFLAWTDRVIRCQTGNPLMFEDFREEESVQKTDWEGIWARMERRVEENRPQPIEELADS